MGDERFRKSANEGDLKLGESRRSSLQQAGFPICPRSSETTISKNTCHFGIFDKKFNSITREGRVIARIQPSNLVGEEYPRTRSCYSRLRWHFRREG